MLDFLIIQEEEVQKRAIGESYIRVIPSFRAVRSDSLMVRGGTLYAVWDERRGLWTESSYDLVTIVDREIQKHVDEMPPERKAIARPEYLTNDSNLKFQNFIRYCKTLDDNFQQLDQTVIFANDAPKKDHYASKRLSYNLEKGSTHSYETMMNTLFEREELHKLEWAVGAIVTGDSKRLQKFVALYGAPGTGKSTFLDLVELLFEDYCRPFKAKDLADSTRQFSMSAFRDSPLVSVDHDGTLARIEDNTTLNSIISHDMMIVNEKHKSEYAMRMSTFLFLGTNKHIKITDAYSGLIRRLIDVHITGFRHDPETYRNLVKGMKFELGAIAYRCREVFLKAGKDYYSDYVPTRMIYGTNALHNFVDYMRFEIEEAGHVTRSQVFAWYKAYMEDSNERFVMNRREFGEELKAYFNTYEERSRTEHGHKRNVYSELKTEMFENDFDLKTAEAEETPGLNQTESLLDEVLADRPAQYASPGGTPLKPWDEVETTLKDLDTTRLHYVKPELNHIVIDFDLTDEEGKKSREKNLEAIESWPLTYSEYSKSGNGIHLHYIYSGDAEKLSRIYAESVEIKVFTGNASLRRQLSTCNGISIATLTSGLPQRKEKVNGPKEIKSEIGLRRLVEKNLAKMIHPGTKPSMDFIHKILNDAYETDLTYDLTDMKKGIVNFAMSSTNQSHYCLKLIKDLKLKSKEETPDRSFSPDDRKVYFDVEVFPNLFVVCWKYEGDSEVVAMINPTPQEVAALFDMKLVGFFNRMYDNHILYARFMGYSIERLYLLSQALVNKQRSPFGAAYGISYGDIYEYSSIKQSLKRWMVELGIKHLELNVPWDQPVPPELVDMVVEYCKNDVIATEKVDEDRHNDYAARRILSDLSGLPVNSSGNSHSARIIFGNDKAPDKEFVYTDLSKDFPGYEFDFGKSTYRGLDPSEGGFVHGKPGMYHHVKVFDIESMHPASAIAMNIFGDAYTKKFDELVKARLAIKHGDYDTARKMLGGKLAKYLLNEEDAKGLSDALKIVINSVYGLTSAKYDNPFKDKRNIDNIVAKRGALFMIDLLLDLGEKFGIDADIVHIKTDSIKVVNPSPEVERYILEKGAEFGYNFEVEDTFERFCLVNNAVYIAKTDEGKWDAVGAQFQEPYVYKTMFTKESVMFDDFVQVKTVQTSLWLEKPDEPLYFIGKAGAFVPVISGGGELKRQNKQGGYGYASGAKGHMWQLSEVERSMSNGRYDNIDMSYFDTLVDKAYQQIADQGDPEWFLN